MPVIQLTDGRGNVTALGPLKLWATMLHPDSEGQRKEWLASVALDKALEVADQQKFEFPNTPVQVLSLVHRSPDPESIERLAGLNSNYGRLAGDVLWCVLSFAKYDPRYATLRRSLDLIAQNIVRRGDKGFPASLSSLKVIWTRFKSVAHLWAS